MRKEQLSWILYDWANSAYSISIVTAILPLFYKEVAAQGLAESTATAYWGYANTLATLLLALFAPFLGSLGDYGSRKKKYLAFFLGLGSLFTALFLLVESGAYVLCLVFYLISFIGFAGANIFYDSLLVDVAEPKRRDWLSTQGYAWGYLGSTVPFLGAILLIQHPGWLGLDSTQMATRVSFILIALWWVCFSLPLFFHVRQKNFRPHRHSFRQSLTNLKYTLRDISKHKPLRYFLLAYFFYIDGVDTIVKMGAVYGKDLGLDASDLLLVLFAVQLVAFPFALLFGLFAKRFETRMLLGAGVLIYIGITVFAFFMRSITDYWILAMLVASSMGGIQALSRSLFSKLIPPEKAGEYFGVYNIFGKFAAIIGPLLMGGLAHLSGDSRVGILALILLFVTSLWFLSRLGKSQQGVRHG